MITRGLRKGLTWAAGLGLGVGLMIGAAVLAAVGTERLTDADVVARARTLGMINATELPKTPVAQPAPKTVTVVNKVAVISIAPGTDWTQAIVMLKQAGAVTDEAGFLARVKERELLLGLKAGVFELALGEGKAPLPHDAIIDKLTGTTKP